MYADECEYVSRLIIPPPIVLQDAASPVPDSELDLAVSAPASQLSAGAGGAEARKQLVQAMKLYLEVKSESTASEEKESKDATAVKLMQSSAEAGNADAQEILGRWYQAGAAGLAKDMTKAIQWFERATAGGSMSAQLMLGMEYLTGKNVPKDLPKAKAAVMLVAKQENDREAAANAMHYLGTWPTDLNVQESVDWLTRSIEIWNTVEPPTDRPKKAIERSGRTLQIIAERRMTVEIHGRKRKEFNGQTGEGEGRHTTRT